jgi:hypothetical protein
MRLIRTLFSLILFSHLAGMTAEPLSAAVIEHDWKNPGDGLLTYDTVNKREWLDLSQTILDERFPGTGNSELAIRESRFQYVVGQTGLGGLFEGFTVAKSEDVIALAQSAGIDTNTFYNPTNEANTLVLSDLLAFTLPPLNGNKMTIGLIEEIYRQLPVLHSGAEFLVLYGPKTAAGLRFGPNHAEFSNPPGVMLFRIIPEPSDWILIVLALICFHLFPCRRTSCLIQ